MSDDHKKHLFLKDVFATQKFTTTTTGNSSKALPQRDRSYHGNSILSALNEIWEQHAYESSERKEMNLPASDGEYVIFTSATESLKLESLDANGARLLNVKCDKKTHEQTATVFIPDNKIGDLVKKVKEYLTENHIYKGEDTGNPKNKALIDTIDRIQRANVENLWSGAVEFIPKESAIWCELWLDTEETDPEKTLKTLRVICGLFEIEVTDQSFTFPQRTIAIAKANYDQLSELIKSFPLVAEIRKAEELNSFWLNEITTAREDWIQHALENTDFAKTNNFVTILDGGINNGHLLLAPILVDGDKHVADASWSMTDNS